MILALCLPARAFAEVPKLAPDKPDLFKMEKPDDTVVQTGYMPNSPWMVNDNFSTGPSIASGEDGKVSPNAMFGTIYEPGERTRGLDPEQRQWSPVIHVQHFFRGGDKDWDPFIGAGGMYYWQAQARNPPSDKLANPDVDGVGPGSSVGSMWATVFETGLRYRITERANLVFAGQFAPYAATTVLHLQASDGAQFGETTALFSWDGVIGLTSFSYLLGS